MHGQPGIVALARAFIWRPALICVIWGKLLCDAAWIRSVLYLHRTRPSWLEAALLALHAKPHLFVPSGSVLADRWIVVSRELQTPGRH